MESGKERAQVALAAFTVAYGNHKDACDVEDQAKAAAGLAAAQLSAATADKVTADAAAEAALDELLAAQIGRAHV